MTSLVIILLVILGILIFIFLGFQIKPKSFLLPKLEQLQNRYMQPPSGLPEPVAHFYQTIYGEEVPIIESVVINGRGRIKPFGIWLPARFIMVHHTGYHYRHYFEATFFGFPFLRVDEGYLDQVSYFESPMGSHHDDPNTNQAANLALWAEAGWFPSVWLSDSRARWTPVDAHTATLHVPFETTEDHLIMRFSPRSGLLEVTEAMRYKHPGDKEKVLWITHQETRPDGQTISYVTWHDDGKPWAELEIEEMYFNLQVDDFLKKRGV